MGFGQIVLSRNQGSSQLAKLRDSFSIASQALVLYIGTNLVLPIGEPPSGSATHFSGLCLPEGTFLLRLHVPGNAANIPVTKAEQTRTEIGLRARPMVNAQINLEAVALRPRGVFYSEIRKPRWGAGVHCHWRRW